ICVALVALLIVAFGNGSDPTQQEAWQTALDAERLSLFPRDESVWVQIDRWSVPVLGSLISQEMIARVLGARTPSVARRGAVLACGLYLFVGSVPVVLGLLGPALLPGLEQPEQLLPALAQRHF